MSEKMKVFWLGIFIIAAIAILSWLLLFLRPTVGDGKQILKVRFSNVQKISPGTRVTFAGKPIGEVEEINLLYDARDQPQDKSGHLYLYEVVMRIDSHVKIFDRDEIIYSTTGLLGEKNIEIVPRSAPKGSPPPKEVTNGVLYARSTDRLEETLDELIDIGRCIESSMSDVACFFNENRQEAHAALKSFKQGADELSKFFAQANANDLAGKMGTAMNNIIEVTNRISSGKGTLGELIYSNDLSIKTQSVLYRIETLLDDINNYGLLFQYNKGWQKEQKKRLNQMSSLYQEYNQQCE